MSVPAPCLAGRRVRSVQTENGRTRLKEAGENQHLLPEESKDNSTSVLHPTRRSATSDNEALG